MSSRLAGGSRNWAFAPSNPAYVAKPPKPNPLAALRMFGTTYCKAVSPPSDPRWTSAGSNPPDAGGAAAVAVRVAARAGTARAGVTGPGEMTAFSTAGLAPLDFSLISAFADVSNFR